MRQRTNRPRNLDEIPDDPLDEDEQDEITKTLTHDANAQIKEMRDIFGVICAFAAIGCLIIAVGIADNMWTRAHAIAASVLHYAARRLSTREVMYQVIVEGLLVGMSLFPIPFLWLANALHSEIHWSLSVGNLLTTTGVMLLRRENQSTDKAILDLHAAKYRYKSL